MTATDQKGLPLEKQLDAIFSTLQQTGIKLRERHEERERQRRLSEQEARERQQAENQRRKLFEDLENWLKAEQLRRLIRKTSELLLTQQTDVGYAERWLEWAEGHAASLDPFSQGLDKFFKHYQTDSWSTSRRWH